MNEPSVPALSRPQSVLNRVFQGPRGLRSGWRLILFLLFFVGIQYVLDNTLIHRLVALGPIKPIADGVLTPVAVLAEDGVDLIALMVAMAVMGRVERRSAGDYGLPLRRAFRSQFWRGTAVGFLAVCAIMLTIFAGRGYSFGTLALTPFSALLYAVVWMFVIFLAAVVEELTFRGYAQFTLTDGIGFWPATLLTSAAFGISHRENPGDVWPGVVAVVLFGVFQCLTRRRTGTLWFAVGMHAAFNYGEAFVSSAKDSGFQIEGHLLTSEMHGSKWLTGGPFGPEGSVPALVVVLVLLALFALLGPVSPRPARGSA